MFDHVTIRVSDRAASERFYDAVLRTIGLERPPGGEYAEWGDFSLARASGEKPVTRNLHVAFAAPSRAHVDEFWRVGTEAGHPDDGAPGLRPQYGEDYYGAFLLDPDGNSVEAVRHETTRAGGDIDHLWIRVADVAAAARFYDAVAPHAAFERRFESAERVRFGAEGGSFSVVAGDPTRELHLAFPAVEDAAVDEFHRALVGAGFRDNGAPGERKEYHEGYYGAFVLDPDGNNVELVNHNR